MTVDPLTEKELNRIEQIAATQWTGRDVIRLVREFRELKASHSLPQGESAHQGR